MKFLLLALTFGMAMNGLAATKKDPNCEVGLPPGKYSEKSIYRLNAPWTTDAGKEVRLDSLRGKPVVLALFFTSCQHSCPFIVRDMKSLQGALSAKASDKAQFVLVSIDPERDTPEALKAFRKKLQLPAERWMLVRGAPDSVKQLAEKLGFNFSPGSKTQFAHSLLLTVLDGKGEVAHQQAGLGVDRRGAIRTIEKLAAAKKSK
jgi:protein SCO1/2